MMAVGKGSVDLNTREGEIGVGEVLKIPDLATKLLSVSAICKRGNKVVFTADRCEVWSKDGELVISGVENGRLYRLDGPERTFLKSQIGRMANGTEIQEGALPDCVSCLDGKADTTAVS